MAHGKGAIWTERLLLALVLASLGATFNLLIAIHRQAGATTRLLEPDLTVARQPRLAPSSEIRAPGSYSPVDPASGKIAPVDQPPAPSEPLHPAEDPTTKVLASLTTATARESEASQQAERRATALEIARQAAAAESLRWKRRELLVRQQIAGLTERATQLELAAETLDAERDVLAHERDALKAALVKASRRSGFAVLPYKGPSGTWRRPIVLECTGGSVQLRPQGLRFSSMDLSPLVNPRSSPLVRAIAREMLHVQAADTPDGAPAVRYLVFLVRPSGIRAYYEARTCLEPLGIAFGYELIKQNLVVEIPDFDNLATWDGSVPLDMPLEPAPGPKTTVAMNSTADQGAIGTSPGSVNWPRAGSSSAGGGAGDSGRRGPQSGAGLANSDNSTPQDFVWPSRGRQDATGDRRTSGPDGIGRSGDLKSGDGAGRLLGGPGGTGSGSPFPALGQAAGLSGSGSGLTTNGGLNSLPDLEPAEDGASSQPRGPGAGSTPAELSAAASGAGGQVRDSGSGPAGIGIGARGGSGLASSDLGRGGQAQGTGFGKGGQAGPPSGGSAWSASDPAGEGMPASALARGAAGSGLSAQDPSSTSEGGGSSTQTGLGQLARSLDDSQGSNGSNDGQDLLSSASAETQSPAGSRARAASSLVSAPAFGSPLSSSSSQSSNSSTTGLPFGSSSSSSSSPSGSSLSFGQDGSSGSERSDELIFAPAPRPALPRGSIEVPFEIVVVCRQYDVLLHPGGYRLTTQVMQEHGASKESLLAREIVTMVNKRAIVDPLIRPKPRIKFLVESNGGETFWSARRQLLFSLPDWPMSLQVSGPQDSHVFTKETW